MSAAVETYRDEMDATYAVDCSRGREPIKSRRRHPEYRRTGGAPTRVSGMHCRRNKRWTWGSGRGARVLNMRAFAGAVAFAVASVASTVLGVSIPMTEIGNPGNAGYIFNGFGDVAYKYDIGTYETTNQQYVDFLNAVGQSNPNGIYNSKMGTDTNGGIVQSGSPGSYTYSVKGGSNPQGATYASAPAMFVSWYSAARFVNWLTNGQQTGGAGVSSLETGSYTLSNATSGPLPTRNTAFLATNGGYVLPSMDEWFKAAFHNAAGLASTDYTLWGTATSTQPTANVSNPLLANVANYGRSTTPTLGPLDVASYSNSLSSYGLYSMIGNAAEITETRNPSSDTMYQAMSGSWSTNPGNVLAFNAILGGGSGTFVNGTAATAQIGFRPAYITAVPEPSTMGLAGAGVAGLAGLEWNRRRKAKARRLAA
jgi:sulfatase modifying factor 1